jgi:hypothetical protein
MSQQARTNPTITNHRPQVTRTPGRQTTPAVTPERWAEFTRNKERARNRGNWTIEGDWIGGGKEPNAFDKLTAYQRSALVLQWPTDECVAKYRSQSQQIAQRIGYGATIVGGIATQGARLIGSIGASLGTSWLLNQMGGLQIHRGWSYRSDNSVEIKLNAYPTSKNEMIFTRTETLTDHTGARKLHRSNSQSEDLTDISDEVVFRILSSLGNTEGAVTTISCPDATVLLPAS